MRYELMKDTEFLGVYSYEECCLLERRLLDVGYAKKFDSGVDAYGRRELKTIYVPRNNDQPTYAVQRVSDPPSIPFREIMADINGASA